jgi:hypothetical protein
MPVLDGIEATRRLRQLPAFAKLPIVALTAGAFKSQQDAAQAAGMTHFISKPFDAPSTIALIQRLTRQPKILAAAPAPGPAIEPVPPRADFTAPVSVMDVPAGLEIWGDMPSYLDYLQRFATLYSSAVTPMSTSLAQADRLRQPHWRTSLPGWRPIWPCPRRGAWQPRWSGCCTLTLIRCWFCRNWRWRSPRCWKPSGSWPLKLSQLIYDK